MSVLSRVRPSPSVAARNGASGASPASAPALRMAPSRWRQPRLVVGLLLVAGAVLLGGRLVAALDDSVLVWQVDSTARAGSSAADLDVRPVAVRFDDAQTGSAYLPAAQPLPEGAVVAHDLLPGQLLAAADLTPQTEVSVGQLPIDVPVGSLPLDLATGDRVDLWVVPAPAGGAATGSGNAGSSEAVRVLERARVAQVTVAGAGIGDTRQLLVDLSAGDSRRLEQVIGQLATGTPVAVRVPALSR